MSDNVRIKSDITKIVWEADARKPYATATVTFIDVEVDVQGHLTEP